MNICIRNMVKNNLYEMKGKRWKQYNPEFCVHTLNDMLKIILETKDEDLVKVVTEMREFSDSKANPLMSYGAVSRGNDNV